MEERDVIMEAESTAVPTIARCKVNRGDIKQYFSGAMLDARDIIIHVRELYPHPHQKVIIETDISVVADALASSLIFVAGVNEEKAAMLAGIGESCYLPIKITQESSNLEGFGIQEKVSEFVTNYNILNFEILLYSDEPQLLSPVWEFLQDDTSIPYKVFLPPAVSSKLRLFNNGLDISKYSAMFEVARRKNQLTTRYIGQVMDELRAEVRSGKTAIQDLEDTRSYYSRWLTYAITQEFGLTPVYLSGYLSEYVDFEITYPFTKLSFFERLSFVNSLPEHVGYIGKAQGFRCRYQIYQKVYPHPELVFDIATGEVLSENLEQFELTKVRAIDWRGRFPGSRSYLVSEGGSALSSQQHSDAEVDAQLSSIFMQMSEKAGIDNLYLTIRNCVQIVANNKMYVAYFSEPFGLVGSLQSPLFGTHLFTMQEEDFKRIVDVRIVLALESQEGAENKQEGKENFTRVMATAARTLRTAIPTYLLMLCAIAGDVDNQISYYDRRLRRDRCIVPIVTHMDSDLTRGKTVFDYLSYANVKHDKIATSFVSSFGSLNNFDGRNQKLMVSVDTFRGCKLL